MPKSKMTISTTESFGQRLARLRLKAGYTQRDLATEVGTSQRMVAYYEKQTTHPPAHLLPLLAKVLNVSTDTLLGLDLPKEKRAARDNRLWRRFQKIEKMGPREKRQILQVLDAFIEREELRDQRASAAK